MADHGIVAQILISHKRFEYLCLCAKKFEASQKEHSARKRTDVNPNEITSESPHQQGSGKGQSANDDHKNEQDELRTPLPTLLPALGSEEALRANAQTGLGIDPKPHRGLNQFVQHIKPKWQKKARDLLNHLLEHPKRISWETNGDLIMEGVNIGNLNYLLGRTFYGSRRIPVPGDKEWFDLLESLNLKSHVTNKSDREKHMKRLAEKRKPYKDNDNFDCDPHWYKLKMD
jgi:hypothetical protein